MTSVAIIGAQWGDEGKGKITDFLASKMKAVVRFQGGHNAGHTIWVDGKKSVTHLLPSGVIRPGIVSVIGQGVVVDPAQFKKEVENLKTQGFSISPNNLKLSLNASVITIYHQLLDQARENKSRLRIGTTGKGIGPCYEDRASRRGIKVSDLFNTHLLPDKLARSVEEKIVLLRHYDISFPSIEEETKRLIDLAEYLRPYAFETYGLLNEFQKNNEPILFEGAQGLLLDVDFGTFPYVTSSNTSVASTLTGAGGFLPEQRWGVLKAYTTRVGEGPFPTQMEPEVESRLRTFGNEFGSTTGRERKCGWLDLPLLKYAIKFSNLNGLILTKCDVLAMMNELQVCVAYELKGKTINESYPGLDLYQVKPIYQKLPKLENISQCNREHLCDSLQQYVDFLEKNLQCPIHIVSFGQDREELYLAKSFNL